MKRIIRVLALLTIILFTISSNSTIAAQTSEVAANINLNIIINGLENGELANLILTPETEDKEILNMMPIQGTYSDSMGVEFNAKLADGHYLLSVDTPKQYFRDPKGYFFQVKDLTTVNPSSRSIIFNLENRNVNDRTINSSSTELQGSYTSPIQLEGIKDLSAPTIPRFGESLLSTGYHYVGPINGDQNTNGIWASWDIVDPGIDHTGEYEHFCKRVMATNPYIDPWMEIGWIEQSDLTDTRYVYEHDTVNDENYYYSLPSGSVLEAKVERQGSSTYWSALYKDGNTWYLTQEEDLGVSTLNQVDTQGEFWTWTDHHAYLPTCNNYNAYLYLGSNWYYWDWQRWATTSTMNDAPYSTHYSTVYYSYYIHSD